LDEDPVESSDEGPAESLGILVVPGQLLLLGLFPEGINAVVHDMGDQARMRLLLEYYLNVVLVHC
jgi:hypothetical protein